MQNIFSNLGLSYFDVNSFSENCQNFYAPYGSQKCPTILSGTQKTININTQLQRSHKDHHPELHISRSGGYYTFPFVNVQTKLCIISLVVVPELRGKEANMVPFIVSEKQCIFFLTEDKFFQPYNINQSHFTTYIYRYEV